MEEEEAGAKITVKKKKGSSKGKSSFRQTKLTSGGEKNSLEVTKPSHFAEGIEPTIPEFNANPKKPGGGRKKVKAEPVEVVDSGEMDESKEGEVETKKPKTEPVEVVENNEVKKEVKVPARKKAKVVAAKPVVVDEEEIEIDDDDEDIDDMDVRTYLVPFEVVICLFGWFSFQFMPDKKKKQTKVKSKTLVSQPKHVAEGKKKTKAESTKDNVSTNPTKKPVQKTKSPQKPKVGKKRPIKAVVLSSGEDEDESPPVKKLPVKEKAGKKRPKAVVSSSEEEEDLDMGDILPLKKRLARHAATQARQKV